MKRSEWLRGETPTLRFVDNDDKLSAKFFRLKDVGKSFWSVRVNGKIVIRATLEDIWGMDNLIESHIYRTSKPAYANEIFKRIRDVGVVQTRWLLTGKTRK